MFSWRYRWRWLTTALLVGVALWLGGSAMLLILATRRPAPLFEQPIPNVDWARFEQVRLETLDGVEVGAWFAPGSEGQPVVILVHGNGGHRGQLLQRSQIVHELGCSILLLTVRAHGDSSGDFNDIGWGARQDLLAAIVYVHRRCPGEPVILFGVSLGAAASVYATEEEPRDVQGLILECPYQDLVGSAMWHRAEIYLPVGLSHVAFAGVKLMAPFVIGDAVWYSPRKSIRSAREIPVLVFSGERDRRAPAEDGKILAREAGEKAAFISFPDADHNSLLPSDPTRYQDAVAALVQKVVSANRAGGESRSKVQ